MSFACPVGTECVSRQFIVHVQEAFSAVLKFGHSADDGVTVDGVDDACKVLELLGEVVAHAAAPLWLAGTSSPLAITAALLEALRLHFASTST
jgi:hypothetical protein